MVANRREVLTEWAEDEDIALLFADGLDDAIIGTAETASGIAVVYDERKVIACFEEQGMTEEEAIEFYQYNVLRALPYYRDVTPPIFVDLTIFEEE